MKKNNETKIQLEKEAAGKYVQDKPGSGNDTTAMLNVMTRIAEMASKAMKENRYNEAYIRMREYGLLQKDCENNRWIKEMPTVLSSRLYEAKKKASEYEGELPKIIQLLEKKTESQKKIPPPVSAKSLSATPYYATLPSIQKPLVKPSNPKLKQVLYPMSLINSFIKLSNENTYNSIETCGILCGIEKDNIYIITSLLLPYQTGTSDTCVTLDYEQISKYLESKHLIALGWIHTHPDYTCFLSSVDLHTQFSYQKLLPEAIAIVYSGLKLPPADKIKAFRVKEQYLDELSKCQLGGFHKHSVKETFMFEECQHVSDYDPDSNKILTNVMDFREF